MFYPWVNERAVENVAAVLRSRWIGEGPKVRQFEKALCDRFGFRYAVALNSGTAALRLALALAGVGPGDEVITTAMTCTATNTPILEQYAKPVFADIQYWTGNIDPFDIAHRITDRTKAIMAVHWAGYPCDLAEIHEVANRYGLPVIGDGAHALGALYHYAPIGTISTYTMFSFQAIKQLTTGDGGLLTVQDQETYDAARRRRWFGIDRDNRRMGLNGYAHWDQSEVGYKMQMNDIAAAIGLGNLSEIDWILGRRHKIAACYRAELAGVPGVHLFDNQPDRKSGDWLFTMHVDNRDGFCRMMRDHDIEVSVAHIRNDLHTIFGPRRDDLPTLDRYESSYISIPLHNHLTDDDVERVILAIQGGW
jgi:perosamine synthetase